MGERSQSRVVGARCAALFALVGANIGCQNERTVENAAPPKVVQVATATTPHRDDAGSILLDAALPSANPYARTDATHIVLERTMCFGTCPVYRVEIYGDGIVRFHGEMYVAKKEGAASISTKEVEKLLNAFEKNQFLTLAKEYAPRATDHPSEIVTLHWEGGSYRSKQDTSARIGRLSSIADAVDRTAHITRWTHLPDGTPVTSPISYSCKKGDPCWP